MKKRLENNGLCVVVVAEGAGQELLESSGGTDASGNPILGEIGKFLTSQVHGAFAGYTDFTIGLVNTHYVFLPIPKVTEVAREVDPNSNMWHRTVTATGQPDFPPRKKLVQPTEKQTFHPSPGNISRPAEPQPSEGPLGDSNQTNSQTQAPQCYSQFSIKIGKDDVQIRSTDHYCQNRHQ